MWLAVCEPEDEAGLWAVAGLRRLGMHPLEVVLPDELAVGAGLVHRLGGDGATVELRLARGLVVSAGEVRGVLNRMVGVPQRPLEGFGPADREYVAEELGAAFAGWFASLPCPVLNRPTPGLLSGPWRAPAEWRALAARVGLPARSWRLASWDEPDEPAPSAWQTAVVIAGRVTGPVPDGLAPGCAALAEAAGATLLGVRFVSGPDGVWLVHDATPLPDLRGGGRAALQALGDAFGA